MIVEPLLFLIGVLCQVFASFGSETNEWLAYKAAHGKSYESQVEESMRHSIFFKNKQLIEHHNAGQDDFDLGLNHLSDRTDGELQKLLGFKLPEEGFTMENTRVGEQFLAEILTNSSNEEPLPESVDWRQVAGRVSEVKNQGDCGSCWAFSVTGLLEGQQLSVTKAKELVSLSEQDLIDCSRTDGCYGGLTAQTVAYIAWRGGIDSEKSYPYEERVGKCRFNRTQSVMTTRGSIVLPEDEQVLKAVVAKYGPVSVAIQVTFSKFILYRKGVMKDDRCLSDIRALNHAVLVVGYGTDPKEGDFWLVKNTWGPEWGEAGYIRMARNRNNMCGIVSNPIIAAF